LGDAARLLREAAVASTFGLESRQGSEIRHAECRIDLDLAEVHIRAGNLEEAFKRSVRAGITAVRKRKGANEARQSQAYVGYGCGLRGDVSAALRHFRRACFYQQRFEYTKRPLYGLYGLQLALVLAHLGEVERARQLTEANVRLLEHLFGKQ